MSSTSQILPGFSAEQTASLKQLIQHTLREALEPYFGPLSQYKKLVSMPKPAPQEQGQKHRPLPQAIAEDNTESTAESISSIVSNRSDHTSLLPTISRLRTMSTCRESTSCLSTARIQYTPNLALASFLASFFDFFSASLFASLLGYIRHAKDMEPTGQG